MVNRMVLFSGGKDSMYALERCAEDGGIDLLVSIVSVNRDTRLHAGPETNENFRKTQLASLDFPTEEIIVGDGKNYLGEIYFGLKSIVDTRGIRQLVTGDLWHPYTGGIGDMLAGALNVTITRPAREACPSREYARAYVMDLINRGMESTLVSVRENVLPSEFVGRNLNLRLVDELEKMGIDSSGESGEYQSTVNFSRLMNRRLIIDAYDVSLAEGKNGKERFHRMNIKEFHTEDANRND